LNNLFKSVSRVSGLTGGKSIEVLERGTGVKIDEGSGSGKNKGFLSERQKIKAGSLFCRLFI
jgi:hypothetical protein